MELYMESKHMIRPDRSLELSAMDFLMSELRDNGTISCQKLESFGIQTESPSSTLDALIYLNHVKKYYSKTSVQVCSYIQANSWRKAYRIQLFKYNEQLKTSLN